MTDDQRWERIQEAMRGIFERGEDEEQWQELSQLLNEVVRPAWLRVLAWTTESSEKPTPPGGVEALRASKEAVALWMLAMFSTAHMVGRGILAEKASGEPDGDLPAATEEWMDAAQAMVLVTGRQFMSDMLWVLESAIKENAPTTETADMRCPGCVVEDKFAQVMRRALNTLERSHQWRPSQAGCLLPPKPLG